MPYSDTGFTVQSPVVLMFQTLTAVLVFQKIKFSAKAIQENLKNLKTQNKIQKDLMVECSKAMFSNSIYISYLISKVIWPNLPIV